MKVTETALPGVLLVEPRIFRDDRGYFMETYSAARYRQAGIAHDFVQDNFSSSVQGTLRGLHYQLAPHAQGKLVQVLRGRVLDVAVDIRRGSPSFGKHVAVELSGDDGRQLWIPPGFAHGFEVLSERADFSYKCTAPYAPECERSIVWNDPDLALPWTTSRPLLSPKDAAAPRLCDAVVPDFGA